MNVKYKMLAAVALAVLAAVPAQGVVAVKTPLSMMRQASKVIWVGKVTAVTEGKGFTVAVTDALKGEKPAETMEVVADDLKVAVGSPMILFDAAGQKMAHVGDAWWIAQAQKEKLKITGSFVPGAGNTFPGSTAGLVQAMSEYIKTGNSPLLDKLEFAVLNGDEHVIQKLAGIKDPTSFAAADVDGDGRADLLVCAAGNVRLFLATDNGGYLDATEKYGLPEVKGKRAEFTWSEGEKPRIELRVDGKIFLLNGGKFEEKAGSVTAELQDKEALCRAMGKFGAGAGNDVMEVQKEKILRIESMQAQADDLRLVGKKVSDEVPAMRNKGFANPQCTGIDVNGDGRLDFLVRTDDATILLVNRGFGAFMVDDKVAGKLTAKGLLAAGTREAKSKIESLLVLGADGTVTAVDTKMSGATGP